MPSNSNDLPITSEPHTPTHTRLFIFVILILVLLLGVISFLYMTQKPVQSKTENQRNKNTVTLPPNAVAISGCIAHEGVHWVEPEKVPNGPFYVTYNDKVVAVEYMLADNEIPGNDFAHMNPIEAQAYLASNKISVSGLVNMLTKSYALPPVEFVDWNIHWTPPHAAFVVPHYDIHFFLVDQAARDQICPASTFEELLPTEMIQQLKDKNIPVPAAP